MHSISPNSVPTESNGTDTSTVQAIPRSGEVPLSINRLKIMNSPTLADVSHSPVNSHLSNYHQTSVIILFSILAAFVLCSLLALLAWKRIRKRSRKLQELNYLTSSCGSSLSSSAHFALGIKPDQSIEFVVPTITLPETTPYSMTEDSFTDSDYYPYNSPIDRDYYGGRGQRKRHLTGHSTYLSVSDIGRAYCGPQSEPETAGKVNFVLHYSIHRQQLLVTLLSASDLPASERKGSINPFAKIVLLPEKSPKFHTKVHRNNRNPVFNEMFIFPARKETLDERRLRISIWDSDRFNRKFFVGQVVYNLAESGITSYISSDVITDEILCPLSPHKSNSSTGELSVAVLFKPEIATLTVTINKARGLMVKDISTVYIKVSLYVSKKKVGSKKSPIRKAHTTVDFNDSFHVHVKDSAIENVNVVVNLIGRSSLGLNAKHNLGKVYIGSCCYSSDGSNQWVEMLKEKGRPIVKWHALC